MTTHKKSMQPKSNSWFNWLRPQANNAAMPVTMQYVGGRANRTGEVITPETCLQNPTVFSAVQILAQTIAQLPWGVSQAEIVGFTPVKHPLLDLLNRPNPAMSSFELKFLIVVDLLTHGNCYLLKVVTASGKTIELVPLRPDQVVPVLSATGKQSYKHENGTIYPAERIIHIRDFIGMTATGLSRVNQCATLVGISNAIDNTLADNFRNGTAVSGIVSFPEAVPPEVKQAFSEAWAEKFGNAGSAKGSIAVLDNGATFTQVESISPADADLLNLAQQTASRILSIFRIPQSMGNIADGSKYNNLQQQMQSFFTDTISPMLINIQQKMSAGLLPDSQFQIEFDSSGLIKGDMGSAVAIAVQAVTANLLTIDEARSLFGFAPSVELTNRVTPKVPETPK
jgi:HK97 family phage portal protein